MASVLSKSLGIKDAQQASDPSYAAIYRLYRAGILKGNDAYGTFGPSEHVTRASAAVILSRTIDPAMREKFTLEKRTNILVPQSKLANRSSIQKKASDAELSLAYEEAKKIVEPMVNLSSEAQLCGIFVVLRIISENEVTYSDTASHYNDPYGFFIRHLASCAGCTRSTGLCLNILGIPYEHVNENKWGHQWTRVNVNGTYWICDPFGYYCGPEEEPYKHPTMS